MRAAALAVLLLIVSGTSYVLLREPPEDWSQPPAPWALDARYDTYEIDESGRALTLHYLGATRNCYRQVGLVANESGRAVRLTLIEERHSREQFCELDAPFLVAHVTLADPLGNRAVFDTTSGDGLGPWDGRP